MEKVQTLYRQHPDLQGKAARQQLFRCVTVVDSHIGEVNTPKTQPDRHDHWEGQAGITAVSYSSLLLKQGYCWGLGKILRANRSSNMNNGIMSASAEQQGRTISRQAITVGFSKVRGKDRLHRKIMGSKSITH